MTTIIDQLPLPVPSRTDPANFSVRADNFLGELPDFATQMNALATELNALGVQVEASKTAALTAETNAQASAFAASGSANNAASSSGAALWVSGTTYSLGALVYSPITGRTYRRKIAGAGTTDPSADATNWIPIVLEISTQYPTIRPSLNLDFVNNKYLDPRITFTRSSTAKYYDGRTIHKAEENLFTYSEQFDNAIWIKANTTVSTNTTVGPFGASTSDTMTEVANTAAHSIRQSFTSRAGESFTLSVFAKYNTRQHIQLCFTDTAFSTTAYANFDIQNGTLGTVGAGTVAVIDNFGNGWYRCSITCTAAVTVNAAAYYVMANSSSMAFYGTYAGSTSNSVYIFGGQVEQRSSVGPYQPTTTQPITNYQSTLVTAANNQPRFDHDPVTKECKGLLIEDATTNLLTYSEDFGNAAWVKSNSTVPSHSLIFSPDGTQSARKIIASTSNSSHFVRGTVSTAANGNYSLSIYAKSGGYDFLALSVQKGSNSAGLYYTFDLLTGAVLFRQNGGAYTSVTASTVDVGNGWWRCVLTFANTAVNSIDSVIIAPSPTASPSTDASYNTASYTGDGYSGIYIWGVQLEANSASPSSYVSTTGTTASRSYDDARMSGTNFSSWYDQNGGTVYSEFKMEQKPLASYFSNAVWSINDSTSSNILYVAAMTNNYLRAVNNYAGVTTTTNDSPFTWVVGTLYRSGFSFSQDDYNTSFNSSTVVSDASGALFKNMSLLRLGGTTTGTSFLRGHLRRFTYYPKKLTNPELQTLTAI